MIDLPIHTNVVLEQNILREHFVSSYQAFSESDFLKQDNFTRASLNLAYPTLNICLGESDIKTNVEYFQRKGFPFVWFIEKNSNITFEQQLKENNLKFLGEFLGMISPLKTSLKNISKGEFEIEIVHSSDDMDQFGEVLGSAFEMSVAKEYAQLLFKLSEGPSPKMIHYVIKDQNKVVSGISATIIGDTVGIWNLVTKKEYRKKGLATDLITQVFLDAKAKGCKYAVSYLTSEVMALGIFKNLGFEIQWELSAYLKS